MQRFFDKTNPPPSANAEFFWQKNLAPLRKIKKQKKKIVVSRFPTWIHNFAVHHSTHYSIPLSLVNELKIVYMRKTQNNFFELEKKS